MESYDDFSSCLPKSVAASLDKTLLRLRSVGSMELLDNELSRVLAHVLRQRGKMVRPSLLFLCAEGLGLPHSNYIDLAASIELLHVSSMIHDDIIDRGVIRRSSKTVNLRYGEELALLSGDALIAKAILLASGYGRNVLGALSGMAAGMCAGEAIDYRYQRQRRVPTLQAYVRIAELKTGSAIATASAAAAIESGNKNSDSIYKFGMLLGVGFQMRDDILDFISAGRENLSLAKGEPNIVTVLRKKSGIGTGEAIKGAVRMNQDYIEKALAALKDAHVRMAVGPYAMAVRMGF